MEAELQQHLAQQAQALNHLMQQSLAQAAAVLGAVPAQGASRMPSVPHARLKALRTQFQHIDSALEARLKLVQLAQGPRQTVQDYAGEYRRLHVPLPTETEEGCVFGFLNGLRAGLREKVWTLATPPSTLQEAITTAARLDTRAGIGALASHGASSGGSHAMDLSAAQDDDAGPRTLEQQVAALQEQLAAFTTRHDRGYGKPRYDRTDGVTPEQIVERRAKRQCFACGSAEHIKRDCPKASAGKKGSKYNGSSSSSGGSNNSSKRQGNW